MLGFVLRRRAHLHDEVGGGRRSRAPSAVRRRRSQVSTLPWRIPDHAIPPLVIFVVIGGPPGEPNKGTAGRHAAVSHHNCFDASRAPSASDASFIQTILVSTWTRPAKVPKPQSTPAMTLSRPTALAYCTMRSATSSGCSTKFEVGIDHAGDDGLAVRQLDVLPHLPLVAVARIGAGKRHRHRLGFEDDVDDVLDRDVAVVRAERRAPADMHAHAVGRQVLHRVVERLDVHRDDLAVVGELMPG